MPIYRTAFRVMTLGAVLALAAPVAAADDRGKEPKSDSSDKGKRSVTAVKVHGPAVPWLGLVLVPVDPALRTHLDLPDDRGMIVQMVIPGSPAEDAGLKQYDVVTEAGGKLIAKLTDLKSVVDKSQGEELELAIVRSGKKQEIAVQPGKTTDDKLQVLLHAGAGTSPVGDNIALPGLEDVVRQHEDVVEMLRKQAELFQKQAEALEKQPLGKGTPLKMRFFGPGVILDKGSDIKEVPTDLSITITKHGNEPATIAVKQGEKSWKVTEETLDQLPEEIRPHVRRWTGGPADFNIDVKRLLAPHAVKLDGLGQKARTEVPDDKVKELRQEFNEQIKQMREEIEQLRQNRVKPDKGTKPTK